MGKGARMTLLLYWLGKSIQILLHTTRLYVKRVGILFLIAYNEGYIFTLTAVFKIHTIIICQNIHQCVIINLVFRWTINIYVKWYIDNWKTTNSYIILFIVIWSSTIRYVNLKIVYCLTNRKCINIYTKLISEPPTGL